MLTIDGLRKLRAIPVCHPLGAVRLTFRRGDHNFVYHFYSDQSPMDDPTNYHSHPYTFTSKVFKGTIRNLIYEVTKSKTATDRKMIQRECCKGSKIPTIYENVNSVNTLTFEITEGQSYTIHHSVIHKLEIVTPKAITLLDKGPIETKPYFVLEQHKFHNDEELFNMKPVDECWEIIRYTLDDYDR